MDMENVTTTLSSGEMGPTSATNMSTGTATRTVIAISRVTNIILLCIVIYMVTCWCVYGYKRKKFKASDDGKLFIICFISLLVNLPLLIATEIAFNVWNIAGASTYCETISDAVTCCYAVALLWVYIFLWMRQRAIYQHSLMVAIHGKFINVISWLCLALLVISFIALTALSVVPTTVGFSDEKGCIHLQLSVSKSVVSAITLRYILLGGLVFLQLLLLFLFIYPMIRMKRSRRGDMQDDSLSKMIRRSTICFGIAIVSDTSTAILTSVSPLGDVAVLSQTMYNVNQLINCFCTTATFETFLRIFAVFCRTPDSHATASGRSTDISAVSQTQF